MAESPMVVCMPADGSFVMMESMAPASMAPIPKPRAAPPRVLNGPGNVTVGGFPAKVDTSRNNSIEATMTRTKMIRKATIVAWPLLSIQVESKSATAP